MENRIKILCLVLNFFFGSVIMTFESTANNLITEIEENQKLGMNCSIYLNSLESLILDYDEVHDSLNIACQLKLKSAIGKLKLTIDKIVDQKLDNYLKNIDKMRTKIIWMKEYSSLESVPEIEENNHSEWNEKYKDVLKYIAANLTETLNEKQNLTESIKDKETILNQTIVKYEEQIKYLKAKTINDDKILLMKSNIISLIRNGGFALGRELFLISSDAERELLIITIYNKNIFYAEKTIELLNSISNDEDIIQGYRLIFDHMIKNQHIYSTVTTSIAYRVFVDFKRNYVNNQNLIHLEANLPESFKDFPWNQTVVIINVKFNKCIELFDHHHYHQDNSRRIPFIVSKPINYPHVALNFIPILNGKYFYIKGKQYHEYLYAESDDYNLDNNKRAVFSWKKKNQIKEAGKWQLESIEGSQYFKIKNVYWNEYLSIAEGIATKNNFHKLFTLKSGKCVDDNCKWHFVKYEGK